MARLERRGRGPGRTSPGASASFWPKLLVGLVLLVASVGVLAWSGSALLDALDFSGPADPDAMLEEMKFHGIVATVALAVLWVGWTLAAGAIRGRLSQGRGARCAACGASAGAGARFCAQCAAPL